MNTQRIALLALMSVLLSTIVSSGAIGLPRLPIVYASPYTDISVDTAYAIITNGSIPDLVILDVRTQSEYDSGHICGAVLIPHTELSERIDELTGYKNHEIIVYCRTGVRSVIGAEILEAHNFTKVYNMLGGILPWQSAGYPVWPSEGDVPFWMQWWVYALVGVLIVALAGAAHFLQKKSHEHQPLLRAPRKKTQVETRRTRR